MPKSSSGRERYNERKAEQLRESAEWHMLDVFDPYFGGVNQEALKLAAADLKKIVSINQALPEDNRLLDYIRQLQGDTNNLEEQWQREEEEHRRRDRARSSRRRTPYQSGSTAANIDDYELPF